MQNNVFLEKLIENCERHIFPAIIVTLKIVSVTMIIGFTVGFILAILLTYYSPDGLSPNKIIYNILDFIVNSIRSFPMLILIVTMAPITRFFVGSIIGERAAIIPLSIAATTFMARMLENNFKQVDSQLVEASKSFGASHLQILFFVIIKESVPAIVSTVTMVTITYISASTIAGAVGGGGLGAVALTYGYHNFNNMILYTAAIFLYILVQATQFLGNYIYKKKL